MRLAPLLAALFGLAACQPLPHPFAADAPAPGAPILALPDDISVVVAPVAGEPRATAEKLAPKVAEALQQHEVAASTRTASIGSYQLSGTISPLPSSHGKAGLFVLWQLRDPKGKPTAQTAYAIEAGPGDWRDGNDAAVGQLAAGSAERIAHLLLPEAPAAAPVAAEAGRTRLLIGAVKGSSTDGDRSLRQAITAALQRQDLAIVADPGDRHDLSLEAAVAIAPPKDGKQHVKIVWAVRRADGTQIGTVAQENDVPAGLLDGPWGDVAYEVAEAAQPGIMALVSQAPPAAANAAPTDDKSPAGKS